MPIYDVYVVGMRKELFVDSFPGEDMFDYEPGENEKYILFCVAAEGRVKFTIALSTEYGWCGSGYTTASWVHISYDRVESFGSATHLPKDRKILIKGLKFDASKSSIGESIIYNNETISDEDELGMPIDYKTNAFAVSVDGDDEYYPKGYASVNEDLFVECPRAMKQRPVWILNGASGTGKSTIGHILSENDKTVYETDSANNGDLPKEIWADVIVVGNKWKDVTVDEIKKHLPEGVTAIDVTFSI